MSYNHCIANMLGIKDENITFSENFTKRKTKDITYNILEATLSYTPSCCPKCGCINENNIIKYGYKTCNIKIIPTTGNPNILKLKKQRFLCKECNSSFSAETNLVAKNCSISRNTKFNIIKNLSNKISEKDIATYNFVSHSTVSRIINNSFTEFKPNFKYLPKHLCFDEFKSTKNAKGSMSFIYSDATNHELLDIVENRQLPFLLKYFRQFSKKARFSVRTICIDMYKPYISLIKAIFPNAKIIFDRFHIVNNLSRALNKTRIELLKKYSTSSLKYKRLKYYWKLILKDSNDLDASEFKDFKYFKEIITQNLLIQEIISIDDTLKNTYDLYQMLLWDIKSKNYTNLETHLNNFDDNISEYMKTAIKTLTDNLEFVINALKYEYSNGSLEGINNFIKTIKRIAFGYRSFFHFRNRILIAKKLIKPKKNISP